MAVLSTICTHNSKHTRNAQNHHTHMPKRTCHNIMIDSGISPTNTPTPISSESLSSFDNEDLVLLVAAATGRHSAITSTNKELLDTLKREENNRRRQKGTPAREGVYQHREVFPSWRDMYSDPSHKSLFWKKLQDVRSAVHTSLFED